MNVLLAIRKRDANSDQREMLYEDFDLVTDAVDIDDALVRLRSIELHTERPKR